MTKNPDVDKFLVTSKNPLVPEINRVREIFLEADDKIEETIKWSSPTFVYKGNIASFFMNAKKNVSLMFHKGAFINDTSGLLQGDGKEARTARFDSMADVEKKKDALQAVIREWIRMQDQA